MDKRGLSTVIITAIIVLIAIISVIGFVVFLNKSEDKFESGLNIECFNINLKPTKCNTYGYCGYKTGKHGYEGEVVVRRDAGKGEFNALRFLFVKEDFVVGELVENTDISVHGVFNELESRNFREEPFRVNILGTLRNVKSVSVIALIGNNNISCPVKSTSVSCNKVYDLPIRGFTPSANTISRNEDFCCQYPWNINECTTDSELISDCNSHNGCNWDATSLSCVPDGNALDCNYFNQLSCEYHGCNWDIVMENCGGIPDSCDSFTKPRKGKAYCCDSVPGGLTKYPNTEFPHCVSPGSVGLNCGSNGNQQDCSVVDGCYWSNNACVSISCKITP